jgi:hypothetical protein
MTSTPPSCEISAGEAIAASLATSCATKSGGPGGGEGCGCGAGPGCGCGFGCARHRLRARLSFASFCCWRRTNFLRAFVDRCVRKYLRLEAFIPRLNVFKRFVSCVQEAACAGAAPGSDSAETTAITITATVLRASMPRRS